MFMKLEEAEKRIPHTLGRPGGLYLKGQISLSRKRIERFAQLVAEALPQSAQLTTEEHAGELAAGLERFVRSLRC